MKKVLCAIVGAVSVAGVLYAAYEAGRGKGYTDGLRDAEEKHKCDCHCCPDEVLCNNLEAEGEARQTSNTETSMSDTSTASTETE